MGEVCSRDCGFCLVKHGKPAPPDSAEPDRLAAAVAHLGLDYVVITSVTRDDLRDGGAAHFAATVWSVKTARPGCRVEVLVPDLRGSFKALSSVASSPIDVLAHNLETVPSLYHPVRPQADYRLSLDLLRRAKSISRGRFATKSGMMLGLGETSREVLRTLRDLKEADCDIITLGQYLQPSKNSLPVAGYLDPSEFECYRREALKMGFRHVEAGPLVRSSYHAGAWLNESAQ